MKWHPTLARLCTAVNTVVLLVFAFVGGLFPFGFVVYHLSDSALREPGMPRAAVWMHQRLSPKHDAWARARMASDRPGQLTTADLAGTEWPLFGSVFYLWTTEALQQAHKAEDAAVPVPSSVYAAEAIESATTLVLDPGHAEWVRRHWGNSYLDQQNAFYRMLILSAATSHRELTGETTYAALLEYQSWALVQELSAAPFGLIEDYPGECYPGDVMAVVAAVSRSGQPVPGGADGFRARALRAFESPALDPLNLPPYQVASRTGQPIGPSRGCSNSYLVFLAADVYPALAVQWYDLYEEHFWQQRAGVAGFREYPRSMPEHDWELGDLDAGPIIGGFGMAASAFGVAAARSVGRYDHAYPLAAQMLAASWPLPDGTLLLPRILSNSIDAPHLGEACILYNLTRQPAEGMPITTGGRIPLLVYAILAAYLLGAMVLMLAAWQRAWPVLRSSQPRIPFVWVQAPVWAALFAGGVVLFVLGHHAAGLMVLVLSQLFPRIRTQAA